MFNSFAVLPKDSSELFKFYQHYGCSYFGTNLQNLQFNNSISTFNVTNMKDMFSYSKTTTLDLSSFDTSKVKYTNEMFKNAKATTGYARTQADADKFNNSSNKPSSLTFIVK